jgi:hypothetical protein
MRPLLLLAVIWVMALVVIGTISRRQAMAQDRPGCMLCGTSNAKMYANPLTGQIYAVGPVITPTATPTATASPTATPTP